ncbi:PucR family transcriptional regulator [Clostridium oryzae]|uniref:Carbohydrate diacid regulator n=1 Tax=Clostridium oryzae TaxID=1450648 RepID=A0A1V4ISZ2_9CLOT|nr:helix-turn-helix domain-containing protein [Clostridium oryzae]OPJ63023.1 carbohydrate diacid regulator [Clostridium oryzae]
MFNFKGFLKDLSDNTQIKFKLVGEDKTVYIDNLENTDSIIEDNIFLGKNFAKIYLDEKYEVCIPLLKYSIENKYIELYSLREQSLIDILEGKELSINNVEKSFQFISKGCTIFLVNVDGSKYEALNIIKQLYNGQDIISIIYGDNIIIFGYFDEIEEHAQSIKESIVSDLYCKCYISFGDSVHSPEEIKKAYDRAKESMIIGKKFDIRGDVFNYKSMFFEKIVYNISPDVKKELFDIFKDKLSSFDNEMINTIEEFVNCGLNISDASKKLYIHRNTLIYRLDKISKDTGYDIRDFKQATIFIIAFLIWKENR